jgi:hypothetical protein
MRNVKRVLGRSGSGYEQRPTCEETKWRQCQSLPAGCKPQSRPLVQETAMIQVKVGINRYGVIGKPLAGAIRT